MSNFSIRQSSPHMKISKLVHVSPMHSTQFYLLKVLFVFQFLIQLIVYQNPSVPKIVGSQLTPAN
jgi:hypothetical protein